MRARQLAVWIGLIAAGVALGLGVAWVEAGFAIPKNVVQWFWIAVMVAALGFAGWAAWGYYRALREEDEWE
jgi:ammonia channel protein AmtB